MLHSKAPKTHATKQRETSLETTEGRPRNRAAIPHRVAMPVVGARVLGLILTARAVRAHRRQRAECIVDPGRADGNGGTPATL